MTLLLRCSAALASIVGGGAVGLGAVLLHGYWWGLLLGVAATVALLVALPAGASTRLAFSLGWVAVLWRATTERTEGDYLVSSDARGYTLLVFAMVVLAAGFVGLARRPRRDGDSGGVDPAP